MRAQSLFALLVVIAPLSGQSAPRESTDPQADRFLEGFRTFQKGAALETQNQLAQALDDYKAALEAFTRIEKTAPTWNPTIIDFRERKTREAIARVENILSGKVVGPDPALADLFLNAFQSFQKGVSLEAADQFAQALESYQLALGVMDQIQKSSSTWNPSIIAFRQKKTREAIQRVEQKQNRNGAGVYLIESGPFSD